MSAIDQAYVIENLQIIGVGTLSLPSDRQWTHLARVTMAEDSNWKDDYHLKTTGLFNIAKNSFVDNKIPDDYSVEIFEVADGKNKVTKNVVAVGD